MNFRCCCRRHLGRMFLVRGRRGGGGLGHGEELGLAASRLGCGPSAWRWVGSGGARRRRRWRGGGGAVCGWLLPRRRGKAGPRVQAGRAGALAAARAAMDPVVVATPAVFVQRKVECLGRMRRRLPATRGHDGRWCYGGRRAAALAAAAVPGLLGLRAQSSAQAVTAQAVGSTVPGLCINFRLWQHREPSNWAAKYRDTNVGKGQ